MSRASPALPTIAALAALLGADPALAQDADQPGATFADATGAMWGVGALETTLVLNGVLVAASDACDDDGACLIGTLLASTFTGLSAGVLAATTETPPDVPFAVHQALWGSAGGFVLSAGLWRAADGERDGQLPVSLTFGLLSGVGSALYAYARREALMRDQRTAGATHFMAWGPMTVGLVAAFLTGVLDVDTEAAMILTGALGVATWGIAVAMAETAAAR
jgi:hypothetical protein